jgi:hypothetical protein
MSREAAVLQADLLAAEEAAVITTQAEVLLGILATAAARVLVVLVVAVVEAVTQMAPHIMAVEVEV